MDLTHTAEFTKRAIIGFIVFIVLSIIAFVSFQAYKAYEIANRPPVVEKPNLDFGKLPDPDLPESFSDSSSYSYSLDTTTGNLPELDKVIKVFFMPKSFATLLASEKTANLAKKFDIVADPQILSETLYRYSQDDRNITIGLDSQNFNYTQDHLDNPNDNRPLDTDVKLVEDFKGFLSSLGLLKDGLQKGHDQVQLLKFDENGLPSTATREDAQGALISIWPDPIVKTLPDKSEVKYSILTANPNKSLVNAIVYLTSRDINNYYNLNYTFWHVDTEKFATYPVKSSEEAYEQLQAGEAVVVRKPVGTSVSISSVYLAYFQPQDYTPYLLPIIVFEGPDFSAYLPAIQTTPPTTSSPTP